MILQLIIVQILTFVGLVFVLRKILINSSYKETTRLQQLNEESAQKSQELSRKLLDAENDYKEKIKQAEDEVRAMRSKARKEVDELKEAIISRSKAESEHIIAEALSSKKELREEIEGELKGKAVELSTRIFEKVLSGPEQKHVFDGLLDSVFTDLEAVDPESLKTIHLGGGPGETVDVRTSHPISQKQKERLETILSEKLGQKIKVGETLDPKVIAGIIIMLGSFVIDGSLSEKFRKAAEEVG